MSRRISLWQQVLSRLRRSTADVKHASAGASIAKKTAQVAPHRNFPLTDWLLNIGVVLATLAALLAVFAGLVTAAYLPQIESLTTYKPPIVSQVYGVDGSLVGEFYQERRIVVPIEKIPKKLVQAFLAAEDANFYHHSGIDFSGIIRAVRNNISAGHRKEGGSTITQQVTKSFFLTPEKSFSRKLKEAILSLRLEMKFSKEQILGLYLNQIYFGAGAYGVEVASQTYFAKHVQELTLAEMALLAGLPKAPSANSPLRHFDRAKERQRYVLDRMVKAGFISQQERDHAWQAPVEIRSMKRVGSEEAAYFLESLRTQLVDIFGESLLYRGGLRIYSTMDPVAQRAAYYSVRAGLRSLDRRQGWRGVVKRLQQDQIDAFCDKIEDRMAGASLSQGGSYQGVVVSVDQGRRQAMVRIGGRTGRLQGSGSWAGTLAMAKDAASAANARVLTPGSVVQVEVTGFDSSGEALLQLDQIPLIQGALVAVEPKSGEVRALVGGYDFQDSQFNRALQARRNAGSAFKPIIYAAALEHGLTAATVINDAPLKFPDGWEPRNYDGNYRGHVTMREALTRSINVVSVKILEKIGISNAVEVASRLGISSELPRNLTLALGAASVTPAELTSAFAAFANHGIWQQQQLLLSVHDNSGRPLALPGQHKTSQAVSPETAYIISDLMTSVVTEGTGRRAAIPGFQPAGKTGTTNESRDAWFVGYVPQLAAGVWVGYDQNRSIGTGSAATGGQVAAPIWGEFMIKALQGSTPRVFEPTDQIVFARINPYTGRMARGDSYSVSECFAKGTEPGAPGRSITADKLSNDDDAGETAPEPVPEPPDRFTQTYPDLRR